MTHDLGPWSDYPAAPTLGLVLSTSRLLLRLRRHGVPGPAPPAGVPVDRSAEMRAELAGVFAALQPVVEECRRVEDDAARSGAEAVQRARAGAAEMIKAALDAAPGLAAAAAERETARLDRESERVRADAAAEADRVRSVAAVRGAGMRRRLVEAVLALPQAEVR